AAPILPWSGAREANGGLWVELHQRPIVESDRSGRARQRAHAIAEVEARSCLRRLPLTDVGRFVALNVAIGQRQLRQPLLGARVASGEPAADRDHEQAKQT